MAGTDSNLSTQVLASRRVISQASPPGLGATEQRRRSACQVITLHRDGETAWRPGQSDQLHGTLGC
jgi:hypothetical protein